MWKPPRGRLRPFEGGWFSRRRSRKTASICLRRASRCSRVIPRSADRSELAALTGRPTMSTAAPLRSPGPTSPVLWPRGPPVYPPVQRLRVPALAAVCSLRVDHPPAGANVPAGMLIFHERSDNWTSHASSFRLCRDRTPPGFTAPESDASRRRGDLRSLELITSFEGHVIAASTRRQ
jgi:hypothetical protein